MNQKNIKLKIYTTTWCPDCKVAKRFLNEHGVNYEEIDIDKDSDAEAFVISASGGRRVIPTIDLEGRYLFNPPLVELAKALGVE